MSQNTTKKLFGRLIFRRIIFGALFDRENIDKREGWRPLLQAGWKKNHRIERKKVLVDFSSPNIAKEELSESKTLTLNFKKYNAMYGAVRKNWD